MATKTDQDESKSQVTCFTTVEHTKDTRGGSLTEGSNDEGPVFAARAPFVMSLADERRFLADPHRPGADSARRCIAHVLDTFQAHRPVMSLPPSLHGELQIEARSRRNASQQHEPLHHGKQRILGDEGLLLFVDYQNYTAWGFGKDVIVSSAAASTRDEREGKGKTKGNEGRGASVAKMLPWVRNRV